MKLAVGAAYSRTELNDALGGQRQGGIVTTQRFPVVLIFTGDRGEEFGYEDGFQDNGEFWYTGEGQVGDMTLVRRNLALEQRGRNGEPILVFREDGMSGRHHFVGRGRYLGFHDSKGPDKSGRLRKTIVFELGIDPVGIDVREDGLVIGTGDSSVPDLRDPSSRGAAEHGSFTLAQLRALANAHPAENASAQEQRRLVHKRSKAVRTYVLARAGTHCEGCDALAPFRRRDGSPYLEPHHIYRRADKGPDSANAVIALCPNCHRRVHSGADGHAYNATLAKKASSFEAAAAVEDAR